jgi:ribosomal protein S18 acetylase RimI-like enzyme
MTIETKVVPLAEHRIREAAEVLGRAFHDDPYWSWVLPSESRRSRVLPWFMGAWARYCHRRGEGYATDGRVEGAALWIPPGRYPLSQVGMMLAGMFLLPLKFGPAALVRLMSSLNCHERLHKRDVPQRHWYLSTVGVEPTRQGQGIGSALIQPVLARSDAEGLTCYLETEKASNVPFYQSHGFEVVVEGDLPKGGPQFWTMLRPPRR